MVCHGVKKIMSIGYDLLKGLKVTFKELFRKSVTDKYPKEFREKPQRFHGRHVLNKYEAVSYTHLTLPTNREV